MSLRSARSRSPRRSTFIGVIAVAVVLTAGCAPDAGREVRGDQSPTTAPAGVARRAGDSVWAFAADLLRAVADGDDDVNAVLAPVPVAVGLAQARAGAGGATREQLTGALDAGDGYDEGLGTVWQVLPERSGNRENPDTGRKGRVSVEFASSLWAQQNTGFEDPWLATLAATWDSGVRESDFRSDPDRARGAVNEWAAEATNDHITQLLSRGSLDELTRFLAPSAAYLEAPWSAPFSPSETRLSPFRRLDGSDVVVPLMRLVDDAGARWGEGADWQAVSLPYLGEELDLTIVLPDAGRFREVETGLDGPTLAGLRSTLRRAPVEVSVPRFGFTTDLDLAGALRTLGVLDAFDPLLADFSGVSPEEPLALAGVPHQTFFAIDEEGTEAAGSRPTTRTADASAGPGTTDGVAGDRPITAPATARRTVVVDRPFLVVVADRGTGAPLFYGRVVAPRD